MFTDSNKVRLGNFIRISYRFFSVALILLIAFLCIAASKSSVNTFIVYEGDSVTVFNSSEKNTSNAIAEQGIVIDETKYVKMQDEADHGIAEIYIFPKKKITIKIGAESKVIYTENEIQLADLLIQNNIPFDSDDIVSIPLTSMITENSEVGIIKVTHTTEEKIESIPFSTEKKASAELYKGTTKVIQNGSNGSKKIVYDVEFRNGQEYSRRITTETVVKNPVNKIIEYGTKPIEKSGSVTTSGGEKLEYKNKITMTATAYTTERSSDKITATGKVARVGLVAVDPKIIPLGSRLYIESYDGKSWCYGTAVAADTGVRGNKIDLFFNTYRECISFGRRKATVYILK